MKVIYIKDKIPCFRFTQPVVALGVFDGVHLAHQQILKETARLARRLKGTSIVVTFWPDPHKQKNLYSLKDRLRLIASLGIKVTMVIYFNQRFSTYSAEDFIFDFLVKKMKTRYLLVGSNFRFGRGARGDVEVLADAAKNGYFRLKVFKEMKINGKVISSSLIRKLIQKGKLSSAARFLGRAVTIFGRVIKGQGLGRKLGFPTANLLAASQVLLPTGVYLIQACFGQKKRNGLCYIGPKPSIKNKIQKNRINVEVYLFDFRGNLYGRELKIRFFKKIRADKKFPSLEKLKAQIQKDVFAARRLLKKFYLK